MPKATDFDFHQVRQFPQRSPIPVFWETPGKALDRFCTLKKEMPQVAAWGQTRVINRLVQEQINDNRSEEKRSIHVPLRDCKK